MNKITQDLNQNNLRLKIQSILSQEITKFSLKGKGACNNAYFVETINGKRYIVKQERIDKETYEQNSLIIEANVIKKLCDMNLSVPIPTVVFVSENPNMYGYEYIEGEMMKSIWPSLSEDERINLCREIGFFHAEIGALISKDIAKEVGLKIDPSIDVHPEVLEQYSRMIVDKEVPEDFRLLVIKARNTFDATNSKNFFQFIHNDPHHENILVKDKKISGIIDFGDAEYGDVTKEFSRYIRDYPDYFEYIVSAYEEKSGNKLSRSHLISNALVCGFNEIVEDYNKGGEDKIKALKCIEKYKELLK